VADAERDSDYRASPLLGARFCVLWRVRGGILMDERQRYEQGMKTRRSVLGDAHVDATLKNRNEFTAAFQDVITRYAWGEIWSRPGLPKETRSMLTLAMMVALNRPDELRMHLRAALIVGVTRTDSGSASAECDLLRIAGGQFRLPHRNGSARRAQAVNHFIRIAAH
jgi:4-carboxymuconolactone decarboxylase